MNLYKISVTDYDYDEYDSAIVVAHDAEAAVRIHPGGSLIWQTGNDEQGNPKTGWFQRSGLPWRDWDQDRYSNWTDPSVVTATLIGTADPGLEANSVVLASFNAG